MTPAPALFWMRFACTVQPGAESWLTTPSLLFSPAEPKFCTVKKLIVTFAALPPNAYRLLCRPSRIAPGAPTKRVAVVRDHLAVGAFRQLVGAGLEPVGTTVRVLVDDVGEVLPLRHRDRAGRRGGRALKGRAIAPAGTGVGGSQIGGGLGRRAVGGFRRTVGADTPRGQAGYDRHHESENRHGDGPSPPGETPDYVRSHACPSLGDDVLSRGGSRPRTSSATWSSRASTRSG